MFFPRNFRWSKNFEEWKGTLGFIYRCVFSCRKEKPLVFLGNEETTKSYITCVIRNMALQDSSEANLCRWLLLWRELWKNLLGGSNLEQRLLLLLGPLHLFCWGRTFCQFSEGLKKLRSAPLYLRLLFCPLRPVELISNISLQPKQYCHLFNVWRATSS